MRQRHFAADAQLAANPVRPDAAINQGVRPTAAGAAHSRVGSTGLARLGHANCNWRLRWRESVTRMIAEWRRDSTGSLSLLSSCISRRSAKATRQLSHSIVSHGLVSPQGHLEFSKLISLKDKAKRKRQEGQENKSPEEQKERSQKGKPERTVMRSRSPSELGR